MKTLYYILFGFFGLLGVYFVLTSLFGRFNLWDANPLHAKIVLVVAAAVAARLLYWAYQLGEQQGRWGAGVGVVLLAVIVFQATIFLGALALTGKGAAFFKKIF